MSVVTRAVYDGLLRKSVFGDIAGDKEVIDSSLVTVGNGTITGALFNRTVINRSGPVGAYTDTTDTAANIIAAMLANSYVGGGATSPGPTLETGLTWRWRYINSVAFAMTLAAGTNVTLGANVNVSASSVKDYLITVLNGAPTQSIVGIADGATAVITGMSQAQTQLITAGMAASGTGIPASTTVLSVQPGVGVTLSAATTVAGSPVITYAPRIRIDSLGQMLL